MSFLDRSHTIAKPGFSRWMVPPAALCIHLCIGQAYAFSVFNLPMTKLHRHHAIGAGRLEADRARLDLLHRDLRPRRVGGRVRPLGRGRRSAPGHVRRRPVLGGGFFVSALGVYLHNLWIVYLGYGVLRRHRPRPRLHLAGLDADQMVPRPARHGDRHGDHGLRRRRLHRLAAVGLADGELLDADPCRRRRDLHLRSASIYLMLHDGRRRDRARAGAGLEAGRLDAAGRGSRS